MALLQSQDGISCDKCSAECRESFTYYSFDVIDVQAVNNKTPPDRRKRKVVASLDICSTCMAKLIESIIKINSKPTKVLRCDITGEQLKSSIVHFCRVSKVLVLNGDTNVDENYLELYLCDKALAELKVHK